jgi:hypothetical protein
MGSLKAVDLHRLTTKSLAYIDRAGIEPLIPVLELFMIARNFSHMK